jgi:hypothetical protein
MKNKTKLSSCGCGGGSNPDQSVVVVEAVKKRKRQPSQPILTVKKTQLQSEKEQRNKNRQLANKMVAKAKRELLQKYPMPPQQNVLSAPKHKGMFFPPKQETIRLINRQKVNKQVGELMKEIQTKHKESKALWKKTPSGTWTKNKK